MSESFKSTESLGWFADEDEKDSSVEFRSGIITLLVMPLRLLSFLLFFLLNKMTLIRLNVRRPAVRNVRLLRVCPLWKIFRERATERERERRAI